MSSRAILPILFTLVAVLLPSQALAADQTWPSSSSFFNKEASKIETRHQVNYVAASNSFRINARVENKRAKDIKNVELCAFIPDGATYAYSGSNAGTPTVKNTDRGPAACMAKSKLDAGKDYNLQVGFTFSSSSVSFESRARSVGDLENGDRFSVSSTGQIDFDTGSGGGGDGGGDGGSGGGGGGACDPSDIFDADCVYDYNCAGPYTPGGDPDCYPDQFCDDAMGYDPDCQSDGVCNASSFDDPDCTDVGGGGGGGGDDGGFGDFCTDFPDDPDCSGEEGGGDGGSTTCSDPKARIGLEGLPQRPERGHPYRVRAFFINQGATLSGGVLRLRTSSGLRFTEIPENAEKHGKKELRVSFRNIRKGLETSLRVSVQGTTGRPSLTVAALGENRCGDSFTDRQKVARSWAPVKKPSSSGSGSGGKSAPEKK